MTSSNGNIFRVTGPLCGEFVGHLWVPLPKASDAELWCFFICARIEDWVNNREAGDLRRHREHYDVNVIINQSRRHEAYMRRDINYGLIQIYNVYIYIYHRKYIGNSGHANATAIGGDVYFGFKESICTADYLIPAQYSQSQDREPDVFLFCANKLFLLSYRFILDRCIYHCLLLDWSNFGCSL